MCFHLRRLRLVNIVIEFPGFAPVVGELQIHYRPILELKVCVEGVGGGELRML